MYSGGSDIYQEMNGLSAPTRQRGGSQSAIEFPVNDVEESEEAGKPGVTHRSDAHNLNEERWTLKHFPCVAISAGLTHRGHDEAS